MGQRANLVIGNRGGYELYYSHWCANTLPRDLFWGPDHALQFIRQQRSASVDDGWLDDVWAEGGAVVDPQDQTLLIFGGEDLMWEVPLRRLFLKFLNITWPGWTVRWAFEGIVDIAQYVGVERSHVIAESNQTFDKVSLAPPRERDWLRCVGTLQTEAELRIYPLQGNPCDYVLAGPKLLETARQNKAFSSLKVSDWTNEFPVGGFHVNLTEKQLDFWMAADFPDGPGRVADVWKDWRVNWCEDRFESQIALTGSRLTLSHQSQSQLIGRLLEMLDRDSKPVDVLGLAKTLSEGGTKDVQVSALALRDDRLPVEAARRKSVLAQCVAAISGS